MVSSKRETWHFIYLVHELRRTKMEDASKTYKTYTAFHFKILEQFVDIFESAGSILIQKLSKESGEKSVDIYPYVTQCTLDVICGTTNIF
jgi:hypothetical protein